ncbi:MAG TPA: hypothetical protein V6D12_24295 [Candidatus Obscuribacterales bacterium]
MAASWSDAIALWELRHEVQWEVVASFLITSSKIPAYQYNWRNLNSRYIKTLFITD